MLILAKRKNYLNLNHMRGELFGMPCVGKSSVLVNVASLAELNPCRIEASIVGKSLNIFLGLCFNPKLILFIFQDYKFWSMRGIWRKYLILFERLGRLLRTDEIIVDEGPLQASWALFYDRSRCDDNKAAFVRLLSIVNVCEVSFHVSAEYKDYLKFLSSRARKHPLSFASADDLKKAESWMNEMVSIQRDTIGTNLQTYTNIWSHQHVDR